MPFSTGNSPDKKTIVIDENGQLSVSDDITTSLRDSLLDYAVDIAELNYAQNLNADSRDNIFVDAFVDNSKISSTTNLAVDLGQNGFIELDTTSTGSSNQFSYSDSANSSDIDLRTDVTAKTSGIVDYVKVAHWQDSTNDITVQIIGEDGEVIAEVTNESVNDYSLTTVSFSKSDYSRLIKPNETFTVNYQIAGQDKGLFYHTTQKSTDKALFSISNQRLGYGDTSSTIQGFSFSEYEYYSTGSATSTVIDKGYTPSSVQVDADSVTGADTSVALRVYDGNGNSTTISESQFGDEISVSFSDSSFNADMELNTSDASKTPKLNDYGLNIIK